MEKSKKYFINHNGILIYDAYEHVGKPLQLPIQGVKYTPSLQSGELELRLMIWGLL